MRLLLIILSTTLMLSACGRVADSRINPLNWFGGETEVRTETTTTVTTEVETLRDDSLVLEVLALEAAPHPGGVIVTAKGLAPTQGYFDATLVEISREGAELIFEFRAKPPVSSEAEGARITRELVTGLFLSRQTLGTARRVTVVSQNNRRSVRQR